MKKILCIITFTTLTVLGYSQKMTMNQYRLINYQILRLIQEYERLGKFSKNDHVVSFLKLFENDSAMVYNDYLPKLDSLKKNLTVKEYTNQLSYGRQVIWLLPAWSPGWETPT